MPGAIFKKFQTLEKDYIKASKGRAISAPMKKAMDCVGVLKKTANTLDKYNDLISAEVSKANNIISSDLKAALAHIKSAEDTRKKFEKDKSLVSLIQKKVVQLGPKEMKKVKPDEYRALKVLGTDIAAFESYLTYLIKDRKDQIMDVGKVTDAAERKKKVADKAILQLSKAVKRARSAIQKVKATPTEKIWNDQFKFAGRDVKMALVSLRKAQEGGVFVEWDPVVTGKFFASVSDWDTQKKCPR